MCEGLRVPEPKTEGDLLFESYCFLNGYHAEHVEHPENGAGDWRKQFGVITDAKPDYLVQRASDRAIVEVKEFRTTRVSARRVLEPASSMRIGGPDLWRPLRNSVREAGERQLAPFAILGVPLVVAVTDPWRSDVSFDPSDVVSALFGQETVRVDPEPGGRVQLMFSEDGAVLGPGAEGVVMNRIPHLAAVVAVHEPQDFPRADVYDLSRSPGFLGTPVPETMFDGAHDRWFGFTPGGGFACVKHCF